LNFTSLRIRTFRNIESAALDPSPTFNVLIGQNGQGKTNILEAIHLLATLKSFRGQTNRELIQHGEDQAVISGAFQRGAVRRNVRLRIAKNGKKVFLNDKPVRQLSQFFGAINTVAFSPEDVSILRDSPGNRRLFLDRAIFNAVPSFASESSEYDDALKNRNALLKDERPDESLLRTFSEQMARYGSRIIFRREEFVRDFQDGFRKAFAEIFGSEIPIEIVYRPNHREEAVRADKLDEGAIAEEMREELKSARRRDERRGFTTVGPHRDDFDVLLDGQPMKPYASQGQHRAFVLAFKISEMRSLREMIGSYPVLLLDDVSSELDPEKNRRLFDFLAEIDGQVFITTTDASFIRLSGEYASWRVRAGTVEPMD
jgi:DNA replication and repair protein RecF